MQQQQQVQQVRLQGAAHRMEDEKDFCSDAHPALVQRQDDQLGHAGSKGLEETV